MKRCPVCAELLADDLAFCPFCGESLGNNASSQEEPLSQPSVSPDLSMVACPICGELIAPNSAICPICGEDINSVATPTPTVDTQTESPPIQQKVEPEDLKQCQVCGEYISSNLSICPYCSEPTGFGPSAERPSTSTSATGAIAGTAAATVATSAAASNLNPPPTPKPMASPIPEPSQPYNSNSTVQGTVPPNPKPVGNNGYEKEVSSYNQLGNQTRHDGYNNPYYAQDGGSSQPPVTPPVQPEPEKRGSLKWLVIALVTLLALALGAALYYFLSKDKTDKGEESQETVTQTETTRNDEFEEQPSDSVAEVIIGETESSTTDLEEETPPQTQTQTQKVKTPSPKVSVPPTKPSPDYDGAFDDVAPIPRGNHRSRWDGPRSSPRDEYTPDGRYGRPGRQGITAPDGRYGRPDRQGITTPDGRYGRPDRQGLPSSRRRDRDYGNDEVAPPNSNSSGFHFESSNGNRSPQQGNNGSGFKFQKIDRVPNE